MTLRRFGSQQVRSSARQLQVRIEVMSHRGATRALSSRRRRRHCGRRGKINLGVRDTLRDGTFKPHAAFHGIEIAGGAVHQITPEHHLGVAVSEFGGGAELALGQANLFQM